MIKDQLRLKPETYFRADMPGRDAAQKLKTNQLWAALKTRDVHSDSVYWAKMELRKRGYCV